MNKLDELMNKFLDNEITKDELEELNNLLKHDDHLEKFKALQLFESAIKSYEYEKAPFDFTDKLMKKINSSKEVKSRRNYFVYFMNAILVLLLAGIILLILANTNWNLRDNNFTSEIKNITNHFVNKSFFAISILKNKSLAIISSFVSLIILITFYFTINSHKEFRKKIESISKT